VLIGRRTTDDGWRRANKKSVLVICQSIVCPLFLD